MQKNIIAYAVVILIILGVGGYFLYTNYYGQQVVNNGSSEVGVDLPEGVAIVERDGERFVRDERNGVEFIVGDKIVVTKGKEIKIYENEGDFLPGIVYSIFENPEVLNIGSWLEQYHEEYYLLFYDQREKIVVDGNLGYKILEEGDPEHYNYFFVVNDKVIFFATPWPDNYEQIIKTLNFIKGGYENKTE